MDHDRAREVCTYRHEGSAQFLRPAGVRERAESRPVHSGQLKRTGRHRQTPAPVATSDTARGQALSATPDIDRAGALVDMTNTITTFGSTRELVLACADRDDGRPRIVNRDVDNVHMEDVGTARKTAHNQLSIPKIGD